MPWISQIHFYYFIHNLKVNISILLDRVLPLNVIRNDRERQGLGHMVLGNLFHPLATQYVARMYSLRVDKCEIKGPRDHRVTCKHIYLLLLKTLGSSVAFRYKIHFWGPER